MGGAIRSQPGPCFRGSSAAIFLAIAGRIVPDEGAQASGARSEATLEVAEIFLGSQDESVRRKLALLLKVFEWGAVLRHGHRFTHLPGEEQDAYLRAWEFSRFQIFRFAFSSVRNLVFVSFYTQPETWSTIRYPGPVLETKAAKA